jgi:hypothetical protein
MKKKNKIIGKHPVDWMGFEIKAMELNDLQLKLGQKNV